MLGFGKVGACGKIRKWARSHDGGLLESGMTFVSLLVGSVLARMLQLLPHVGIF